MPCEHHTNNRRLPPSINFDHFGIKPIKQTIHNLIEIIPDSKLPEIANFILFIKKNYENEIYNDEDFRLAIEAEQRLNDGKRYIHHDELMANLGITESDLKTAEDVEL